MSDPAAETRQPQGLADEVSTAGTAPVAPRPRRPLRQLASARVALVWLALLATIAALIMAKVLVLPVLFAAFVALSLNPIVHGLARPWLPRAVVAALVMSAGVVLLAMLTMWVSDPAQHWFTRAPEALRSLAPKLRAMTQPLEAAGRATQSIITGTPPTATPASESPAPFNVWDALAATPPLLAAVFAVVLLVYFFLVYGETLARKTVAMFTTLDHKRNTVDIIQTAQSEMSRYLFITTLINSCVGLGAGLIAHFSHIEDALLWGVLAAVLNFVPYIGPACMAFVFLVLGLLDFNHLGQALAPAGMFLALVILEGQFLTPLILGRNLRLNPVIIVLWLMLLGWMWGPIGVVLAVPALAVVKIVCARVRGWEWIAQAIE